MTTYGSGEAAEQDCLFCRIIRGEIPSDAVLATEHTYAFRDIEPAAPVHVLVVPKRHIESAATVAPPDGALLAELIGAAQQVAAQEGVAERGYRLLFNVGDDALNSVPHLHLHVVGGRSLGWPPG
jgi:histidine triad (HIT) family protein